ncbi:MAG: hypothetical protein GX968_00610 [Tissierellia bacterium]|nr:hypothetical protein [Tissierellia bacterium]
MRTIIVIIFLLLLLLTIEYPNIFLPLIILTGTILFFTIRRTKNKLQEEEQLISKAINETANLYRRLKSQIDIPVETRIVHYKGGDTKILEGNLQIWLRDGILYFFPFIPVIDRPIDIQNKVYLLEINIKDIEYFFREEKKGRDIVLKFSNKGEDYSMIFSHRDYRIFKEIMPDKDLYSLKKEGKIIELASNDR